MKNSVFHSIFNLNWLLTPVIVVWLLGCRANAPEPAIIINTKTTIPSQAALVSVQPIGASTAGIVVKLTSAVGNSDWKLTVLPVSGGGTFLPLVSGKAESLNLYSLNSLTLSGLSVGQTYRMRLGFRYNDKDTLTVERTYTHTAYNPWKKLADLPFDSGEFTGAIVSLDYDAQRSSNVVRVTRYADAEKWQTFDYVYERNGWYPGNPPIVSVRRGLIDYVVYYNGKDRHNFYGLGYQTDELFPGKYVYLRDMFALLPGAGSYVFPFYEGEDGETAYFTTTEWAFFLTNNGSPAMRGIYAQFEQESRAPLPEKPGILATFSIGETGYVVNQVPGRQPRLFAYDSQRDIWSRRADFPGPQRSRGVGFSVKNKGYFGLGTATSQQGLRDIYQYDPATDTWQYLTDYPGQGNRYPIVWSGLNRAYIGWGYESQTVVGSAGYRLVGCTDFWEFKP
ncbi:hypothetical protein [Spirosoma luteum]|uniref:hypothetical protein n=1 Tax=Spirosoma luteum TaxID=431553 RepID=UPI00036F1DC2|nr:hypothetical protein [Spirosoma luteum]